MKVVTSSVCDCRNCGNSEQLFMLQTKSTNKSIGS